LKELYVNINTNKRSLKNISNIEKKNLLLFNQNILNNILVTKYKKLESNNIKNKEKEVFVNYKNNPRFAFDINYKRNKSSILLPKGS